MTSEQWRPIPNFPRYEISSDKRVRRLGKKIRILKPDEGYRVRIGWPVRTVNIRKTFSEVFPELLERDLNAPDEIWKAVPGWEETYEVSNQHRVRRRMRTAIDGRIVNSRLLALSIVNGYLVAYFHNGFTFYVEKAVLSLFPETAKEVESLPNEEWKDIAGYEGLYRISSLGRVLSLPRIIDDDRGRNRYIRQRIREPGSDAGGYPKVDLAKDGKTDARLVHRLVAEAFVPNPLNLDTVHHKDENRTNAKAENLEWTSRAGNIQDWFDRRRVVIGTDTIETIVAAATSGKSPAEILAALPRKRKPRKSV